MFVCLIDGHLFQLDHDEWATQFKHYSDQRRMLYSSWAAARRDLLNRIKVSLDEAWQASLIDQVKEDSQRKRDHVNDALRKKVR